MLSCIFIFCCSTQEVQFGVWPASCVIDNVLWPDFKCFFFFGFWNQIYAHPSTSARHAPLSRIPRRLSPLLPKVLVEWIARARCVVLTCQRVFALWLHVKARLCLFRPCLVVPGVYGVGSVAGCFRCWCVFYMRRHSSEVCHFFHCRQLVFGFSCLCVVYSPCFPGIVCICIA